MVMETPSAQCVGREFVRQYYTLLHEAPDYLHRFYSHNSCFVHGGVEKPGEEQPPVMGQAEIHKKIMDLKFRDCHAKIRQVDSQPTVANAVVVQVTGELSNNSKPMRRFMQTFLLAPQSPKKYYVHNDIFRYQDEVFHDIDNEVDSASPTSQQQATTQENTQDLQQEAEVEETDEAAAPAQQSEPTFYDAPQQQPGLSNGTEAPQIDEQADSPDEMNAAQPEDIATEEPPASQVYEPTPAAPAEPEEKEEPEPEPTTVVPEVPQQQEPAKPVSWAALASQRPQQAGGMPAPQPQQASRPVVSAPIKPPMDAAPKPQEKPQGQRAPRPPRGERAPRDNSRSAPPDNQDSNSVMEPRREQQRGDQRLGGPQGGQPANKLPDAHQLFVGNLPHNIEEGELKEFFEKDFGKVVEVRINRKSSTNRDVPNFGFVVFQSPDTVHKVLASKPIMLRDEIRLNVEEKKQRGEQGGRPGSGTRMGPRGGGQMMGGGGRGGQGGMGPRGGGRGGAGGPPRGGAGGPRGGFGGRR